MVPDLVGSLAERGSGALSDGMPSPGCPYQPVSPSGTLCSPRLKEMESAFAAIAGRPAELADAQQLPVDTAAEPLLRSRQPSLSTLIPLAEVAGSSPPEVGGLALRLPLTDDEEHDDSSCGMDSPTRCNQEEVDAGYESSDDMDCMNAKHCINCTGELWGSVCRACGYMDGHEASIFDPVVLSPVRSSKLRPDGTTVISYDDRMLLHDENLLPLHPERADRIRAVMARLNAAQLTGRCRRLPSREATPQEVERCHVPEHMTTINLLSERSRMHGNETLHWPTSDTYVNQHTALCARLSAGACVDVAVAVVRGEADSGVAIVRPPGHHAESNTAMGFCFFNNAGIAARAAQAAGASRIIILDWDVHHGNGTQHIFESDPSVMYMSLHRYDGGQFYPGTGAVMEVGAPGAEGSTVNVPWPCGGMRNGDYMAAFQHLVLPVAHEFGPDLVIISAGFDAAEGDPIGGCCLTPEVYAHMTAMVQSVAPTVLLLEGGYNLTSVARSTEACVRVLLGDRPGLLPADQHASEEGMSAVAMAMRVQARYWRSLRALVARLAPLLAPPLLTQHAHHQHMMQHGEELDEDTDTPHMPHTRGGHPGWDSDADLQSCGSLEGPLGAMLAGGRGSAAQLARLRENSDTALDTEDGGNDSGEGEVELLQHGSSAHLASPSCHATAVDAASPDLLPLQDCPAGDVATPQLARSLANTTAASGLGGGSLDWQAAGAAAEEEAEGKPGPSAAHNWRKLALKVVALKRSGQQKGPRLSPQLVREAVANQQH